MAYNKIILQGNLTRDIEIRYTQGGTAVGSTGIAVSKKYKTQSGEQREETLFVDLVFWGRTAEIANQYIKKGSSVLVDGTLKLDQWTAQDGTKRSKHSVTVENLQMLSYKHDNGTQPQQQDHGGYQQPQQAAPQQPAQTEPPLPEIDISEDEIPF